jgi:hypothetical protein
MGKMRNAYNIWVEKTEVRRPLGRPRRKWEDNMRIDIWETGRGVNEIHLPQDSRQWRDLVNTGFYIRQGIF